MRHRREGSHVRLSLVWTLRFTWPGPRRNVISVSKVRPAFGRHEERRTKLLLTRPLSASGFSLRLPSLARLLLSTLVYQFAGLSTVSAAEEPLYIAHPRTLYRPFIPLFSFSHVLWPQSASSGKYVRNEHATAVSIIFRTLRKVHKSSHHTTMASYLPSFSSLSPVNTFPAYKGKYEVGTVDVEIPVSELPVASDAPEGAVKTIAFRIFYPCQKPGKGDTHRPVRWIPQPQRATVNAFATFLGAGSKLASFISFMPQQLFWIKLPAHRNAKILDPPMDSKRWPVTMFSHGLAGSRNTYSYICGDMASNGMVVIAMDHRDGSSPIQHVRATAD